MKTRKLVLLASCVILLAVCIIQGITGSISPVKTISTQESPDKIVIETGNEKIELAVDGTEWLVGHDNFKADKGSVQQMIKQLKEIKVLDKVGRLAGEEANARFNLEEGKALVVTATKAGKEIRVLRIGKTSTTGSQTYANIGGSKDVLLVSGNLISIFAKTEDGLKSKSVYTIEPSAVTEVTATAGNKVFGVSRINLEDGSSSWSFAGAYSNEKIDASKVDSWVNQLSSLSAEAWISDSEPVPSNKLYSLIISSGQTKTTVDIYSKKDGDKEKYICESNRTTHRFEISEATKNKFVKTSDNLK